MKRTVILIDGQNLYYSIKGLNILEKEIKWDEFFKSLLTPDDELIRTYWFRPQKIQDTFHNHSSFLNQTVYKKHKAHYAAFLANPASLPPTVKAQVDIEVKKIEDWLKTEKTRFTSIEYNYDQLSLEFGDIEFVKTGIVKVDPYRELYVGEKGVDIALAVKMISLSIEKKCDKLILISGDYDYAEAIKFVKNNMTKIHIVKIHKGTPPSNRSVSRDLAVLADKVIDVYESDMKGKFLKATH